LIDRSTDFIHLFIDIAYLIYLLINRLNCLLDGLLMTADQPLLRSLPHDDLEDEECFEVSDITI